MTSSTLNDWNMKPDAETLAYHLRQWKEPYRSTVAFAEFIKPFVRRSTNIADMGCGAGAATDYLARQFPWANWAGFDISDDLIEEANQRKGRASYEVADLCALGKDVWNADGVVSLQTFSWMPEIKQPLYEICTKIKPKWLAFSSLFYAGDISFEIKVNEHKRPRQSYYNIYSVSRTTKFLEDRGYKLSAIQPFFIDIDLPVPKDRDIMKTYTLPTETNRYQFSGPLFLPWQFLAFERA